MKVSELNGVLLDYWVARAENLDVAAIRGEDLVVGTALNRYVYAPSRRWEQGGPIIEREYIRISPPLTDDNVIIWDAIVHVNRYYDLPLEHAFIERGITPLIAAMRAYVAWRFGPEVVYDSMQFDDGRGDTSNNGSQIAINV